MHTYIHTNLSIYRKTPYINPWACTIQRAFLIGLYAGGLIYGELIHEAIKLAVSTFLVM